MLILFLHKKATRRPRKSRRSSFTHCVLSSIRLSTPFSSSSRRRRPRDFQFCWFSQAPSFIISSMCRLVYPSIFVWQAINIFKNLFFLILTNPSQSILRNLPINLCVFFLKLFPDLTNPCTALLRICVSILSFIEAIKFSNAFLNFEKRFQSLNLHGFHSVHKHQHDFSATTADVCTYGQVSFPYRYAFSDWVFSSQTIQDMFSQSVSFINIFLIFTKINTIKFLLHAYSITNINRFTEGSAMFWHTLICIN